MNIKEAALLMHEAGAQDSHENLQLSSTHGSLTNKQYNVLRTNRHMEEALREFAEKIWQEAFDTGRTVDFELPPNPYSKETP